MRRRSVVSAVGVVIVTALAGCNTSEVDSSGDDDPSDDDSTDDAPTDPNDDDPSTGVDDDPSDDPGGDVIIFFADDVPDETTVIDTEEEGFTEDTRLEELLAEANSEYEEKMAASESGEHVSWENDLVLEAMSTDDARAIDQKLGRDRRYRNGWYVEYEETTYSVFIGYAA